MKLEKLIAEGQIVDIYKSGSYAVELFKPEATKQDVLSRARRHVLIEETGLTVPELHEVGKIDGRWAITMDFIEGETLLDKMRADPDHLEKYVEQMVDLQMEIHSKTSPRLGKLKDKLRRKIESLPASILDASKSYELLTRLDSTPKHKKVCHGNYDPKDILFGTDGKVYITDWLDAAQGNASADVAESYLLLCLQMPEAAEVYLDLFCKKTNTAKKYVQEWLPVVAAAQLTKGIKEQEPLLLKWLDVLDYQ